MNLSIDGSTPFQHVPRNQLPVTLK